MRDEMTDGDFPGAELLTGAGEIASFLFGANTPRTRRRIYHLVECGQIPIFRLGATLHARKSTLHRFIEVQEGHREHRP